MGPAASVPFFGMVSSFFRVAVSHISTRFLSSGTLSVHPSRDSATAMRPPSGLKASSRRAGRGQRVRLLSVVHVPHADVSRRRPARRRRGDERQQLAPGAERQGVKTAAAAIQRYVTQFIALVHVPNVDVQVQHVRDAHKIIPSAGSASRPKDSRASATRRPSGLNAIRVGVRKQELAVVGDGQQRPPRLARGGVPQPNLAAVVHARRFRR